MSLLEIPAYEYGDESLLEPLRPFLFAGYVWRGIAVPRAYQALVPAYGQIEERIQVPPGSYLLGFAAGSNQREGFRFSIYDVGADTPALSDRSDNHASGAQDTNDEDPLPHILPVPYCVVEPGTLRVTVNNLAADANDMQLLLHFAVPFEGGS